MTDVIIEETQKSIMRLGEGKIEILNLIIPKPEIPQDIADNYQRVKVQWTEKLVAEKEQEKEEVRKQTQEMKAVADANRLKAVTIIELERQTLQKEAEKNMSLIENDKYRLQEQTRAEVEKYAKEKASEGNNLFLTDNYIRLKTAEYFSKNTKLFFSGKNSPIGAILNKITDEL